jgi:hypothetical protein
MMCVALDPLSKSGTGMVWRNAELSRPSKRSALAANRALGAAVTA